MLSNFTFTFAPMKTLIKNIKSIIQATSSPKEKVAGKEMSHLPCLDNSWISIENDIISGLGEMKDIPSAAKFDEVIDGIGKLVFPTWCDSHTHIVYATSREGEFVDRIKGLTYEEIAKKGGGILNSAEKLNKTSEDELFESALARLKEVTHYGTGAVEIKSGYGLSPEGEIKTTFSFNHKSNFFGRTCCS